MNYPFDIEFLTKTITKCKQRMWEFEKHHSAAMKYQAKDQYIYNTLQQMIETL